MLAIIIFLILSAVTIVGGIQIITKAGYSPWWILLPLSIPLLWLINIALVFNDFSGVGSYGAFNLQTFADQEQTMGIFIFLDLVVNFVMFLVFAFSEWPVVQAARSRGSGRNGGTQFGSRGPGPYRAGPAGSAAATASAPAPPLPELAGQAPGWHTTGPVGAGEQSYWDGTGWSARRRWQKDAWVDLPLEASVPPPAPEPHL